MLKKIGWTVFIILSVALNIYLGVSGYVKSTYSPDLEDQEILGEMTVRIMQTADYREITEQETVYSITQRVSRFNVADPSSIFHYEVHVSTDQQTYIFYCKEASCATVSNEGWTYSRYSEEKPLLPL